MRNLFVHSLAAVAVVACGAGSARADVDFAYDHFTIDYLIDDNIEVHGSTTTVDIVPGGHITGTAKLNRGSTTEMTAGIIDGSCLVEQSGVFTLFDGTIGSSTASHLARSSDTDWSMHGGTVTGADFTVKHGATFDFLGGDVSLVGDMLVDSTANLTANGGLLEVGGTLEVDGATANLYGGSVTAADVLIEYEGQVDFDGGGLSVAGDLTVGFLGDFTAAGGLLEVGGDLVVESGYVTLDGRNFLHDGVPVGYGELDVAGTVSTLSGLLIDGSPFNLTIDATDLTSGTVTLVPEPATLSLLALGGLLLSCRRR